ncbi:hypothetical protein GSI_03570 [Ganoderma sinense ZZ0214-1]|uniref:EF-hand domain-containing protein n=1 Tax=Ganoderma sinense ZZ0214-1 TaxID=1077348 RepID=A0A2G8SJA6_9APHY|nr:hypothetical protein GSI_03570 [Ganoderma sinense ZZ0214-1]
MQELVKQTAEDIKTCANAGDTYAKKKLLVKVIKGSIWDCTLKGFIDLFANRRKAFTFALALHVGAGVDDANRKLKEIDSKIDMVLDFFSKAVSPERQELAALVQKKGGAAAVMGDNDALEELLKFKPAAAAIGQAQARGRSGREGAERSSHPEGGDELAVVKQELFDTGSPELAIRKNLELFERKFKMQQRELAEEMRRMVHHEGDRVIEAVTSGPHDRIIDPRWPGHVKAHHFVLALRDYYRQQVDRKRKPANSGAAASRIADQDEWALQWININRLQAIAEAFDDDASGFITIAEVNSFTASRPKEWSLPHWIAYWAIGWQMTATKYRDKIAMLCAKMFAIRSQIHPANQHAVDRYLRTVWKKISTFNNSLVRTTQAESLQERFKSYVEAEEQRLREGLETVKYDIDAIDTLLLVTGPGRIEKNIFPLLWLLLHRDETFRLCRTTVIHKDELWDSAVTLLWVFDAVNRHDDLQSLFKQQNLDPGPQFKTFASKALNLWHDSKKFWSLDNLRTTKFLEVEYNDSKEDQNVDISKLLNYSSASDDLYPPRVEDSVTENDAAADEAIRLILGRWNASGFEVEDGQISPMMSFCFHASMDHKTFEASAPCATGTDYNVLGEYTTKDDGTVEYLITQTYAARISKTYWTVTLADDGDTLSGKWGYEKDDQPHTVIYKRIPPEVLIDRPHPREFAEDRARALWKFAVTAVRNQVRRKLFLFSWSYLKERRDLATADFERFSALDHRSTVGRRAGLLRAPGLQAAVRPCAFRFGNSDVSCDHCKKTIYGTRVACMECGSRFTLDFCDKPECMGCTIRSPILHYREIGKVLRNAKVGLERAKALLQKVETQKKQSKEAEKSARKQNDNDAGDGTKDGDAPTSLPKKKILPGRPDTTKSDSDSVDEVIALACLKCEAPVSQPCFDCIDCPPESKAFICSECEEKEGGFSHGEHHLANHNLVRCMEVKKEEESKSEDGTTERRLDALEHKLEGVTTQMEGLSSRMDGLTTRTVEGLTSQMERIEKLLQALPIMRAE